MKTRIIKSGRYFEINITTDVSGRTTIMIYDNKIPFQQKALIEVELPAKTGEWKDNFNAIVKVAEGIETSKI